MLFRINYNIIKLTKNVATKKYHRLCCTSNPPHMMKLLNPPRNNFLSVPCKLHQSTGDNSLVSRFQNLKILWRNIFGKYLLVTNILGSGILMVVGDLAAQEIEYRQGLAQAQRYDWARIGRMFVVGALQGPLHHYAYMWMDKLMPVANAKNAIKKILIDQVIMSPACIFIFYYAACFLERKSLEETNAELREKFLFIYCIDWLVWPGAQYVNFRYLDTKYRVTFVNVCTALYNIFMSYMKHDFDVVHNI